MTLPRRCLFALAFALALPVAHASDELSGAGSSFAAPLYVALNEKLGKPKQFQLAYEAVGSSEGVKRVSEKKVDFGASDRAMTRKELAERGLLQFPTAIGGVVITANLPGVAVANIKLDGAVLGDLFMGRIARWNDARLTALNPGLALPNLPVQPVFRDEGSGTSYLFTSYLAKAHAPWKDSIGATSNLKLQAGVGVKGNGGVVKAVQATPGAVGYLEYGYAQDNKFPTMQLKNAFGTTLAAEAATIEAAVRAADWELLFIDSAPTFEIDTINVGCPRCWPIVGLTYVIVPRRFADPAKGPAFTRFMDALLDDGDALAKEENYVPLPSRAKNLVRVTMRAQMQQPGQRPRSERFTPGGGEGTALALLD
jgi:phosphate transport system substrate-binding protein